MNDLMQRKDVNWNAVKLSHDSWNYKQEGLTEAGAALVAVAVAWATGGGMGANVLGVTTNAAFMSLTTQASISLINNKGDISLTLRDLGKSQTIKQVVSAALTAGVMDKVGALDSFKDLKTSTSFGDKLTYNLVDAGGRALVSNSITGGDIESAIKQALIGTAINTGAGYVASQIKGLENNYIAHKLAHALSGCVGAALADAKCKDGAIGAAMGEIVADLVEKPGPNASKADWDRYSANVNAVSQLAAGAAVAYYGGNAQTAINAAQISVQNNYLSKPQLVALQTELNNCKTSSCNQAQINAILDRYTQMSRANDAALAACTTQVCIDGHRTQLLEAANQSAITQWSVVSSGGDNRLINELTARENKAGTLTSLTAKVDLLDRGRKDIDNFVLANCSGLTQAVCASKLQNSQAFSRLITEVFASFTPIGIAVDVKDLTQAKTMSDYTVATIGFVPIVGDIAKASAKEAKAVGAASELLKKNEIIQAGEQAAQLLAKQQKRNVELVSLFDNNVPAQALKLGDTLLTAMVESNKIGTTKVFDTKRLSDTELEKLARNYVSELTGGAILKQTSNPNVLTTKLKDGTIVNLRSDSKSIIGNTGEKARWTVDIKNNPTTEGLIPNRNSFEVKFQ